MATEIFIFFMINKYGKVIFILNVHFLQISICYKRGVPIRFTMGAPYIINIYMIHVLAWLGSPLCDLASRRNNN